MSVIPGRLYPAGSSAAQPAHLKIQDNQQLVLEAEGRVLMRLKPDELEVSARLGNTPRYLNFADGSRFETADNEGMDSLLARFRQGAWPRLAHQLESHFTLVVVMLLAVIVFVWGSVRYGVPAVASITAEALPAEFVRYVGKGTLEILDESMFEPSRLEVERRDELTRLFRQYAEDYPELGIRLEFRHGGHIGANAMALPDGYIIFTDELVELAENDLELVAILGHEIGHLQRRHLLRRMIQGSLVTVLLVLITGDVSSASSLIYAMPALLLELSYSRHFEEEADDFAYDFLLQHKIAPHYFADVMLRLLGEDEGHQQGGEASQIAETDPVTPYFSTHPDTRIRVQRFLGYSGVPGKAIE